MGTYCVMLPDSQILKKVAGCKSVVIAGCLACASDSIGFDRDYPLSKIVTDKDTGKTQEIPVAVVEEANRLKKLLESEGISASVESYFGLCLLAYDREEEMSEFIKRLPDTDAIITLCCPGGTLGLKQSLNKDVKIVPGMKAAGVFQIYKVLDESKKLVFMDKSRSKKIPLFK